MEEKLWTRFFFFGN